MSFKDNLATDVDKVFLNLDEFGENITYTPSGGDPKTIKAIVNRDAFEPEFQEDGRMYRREGVIFISTDSEKGIASPGYKDTVTFNSETWAIVSIRNDGMGMAELRIVRMEAIEKSQETHRIRRL